MVQNTSPKNHINKKPHPKSHRPFLRVLMSSGTPQKVNIKLPNNPIVITLNISVNDGARTHDN